MKASSFLILPVSYTHLDVYKRQALGHPVGASGNRILVTLIHEMIKRDAKVGLASLCIGGGQGTAVIVKRP